MSKKYSSSKTGFNVISGKIVSIAEDKQSAVIEVENWDIKEQKRIPMEVKVTTPSFTIEDEKVGDVVTTTGFVYRGEIQADTFSKDNMYTEVPPMADQKVGVAVVAGKVLFASKNDEIDKTTGQPRLSKAGTPKKPHFDITIAVGSGAERVTHVVNIYNMPARTKNDGTIAPAQDNIGRYEKLFSKFDREKNPMYCSIITQPGRAWTKTSTGADGRVWENQMISHLGANSVDATFLNEKVKETEKTVEAPTVAPTPVAPTSEKVEPTPDVIPSGFDAADLDLGVEDFGLEG